MRRREFIAGLGGAAAMPAIWPVVARAQQGARMRRIGVLSGLSEGDLQSRAELGAFREGMAKAGWTEGRNLDSDIRFSAGDDQRIRADAEQLIGKMPDVILARGTQATAILQQQTNAIPIVFVPVSDPVASGFVASFARPGGNLTGFIDEQYSIGGKWLSLLKNLAPGINRVVLLYDPSNANWDGYLRTLQAAASAVAVIVSAAPATSRAEIQARIEALAQGPGTGIMVVPSGLTIVNRDVIVALAATHHLPALYPSRFFAVSGGLAAYGPDVVDLWRRAAEYVDRILRGEKPSNLPVQAPTKFEFVLNLKAAAAIGLEVPTAVQLLADEVIE